MTSCNNEILLLSVNSQSPLNVFRAYWVTIILIPSNSGTGLFHERFLKV